MSIASVITIDGPSGTGKGTLCRLLSQHLGWKLLDSGAIYRVLAWIISVNQRDPYSHADIDESISEMKVSFGFPESPESELIVYNNQQDVTKYIRSQESSHMASIIASLPYVRDNLLNIQRNYAVQPGLVSDGRDMGTVVFPDAWLKIYLDANVAERAKRRQEQLQRKGIRVSLREVQSALNTRDQRDSGRKVAPLRPAVDAVVIDSSQKTINMVLKDVICIIDKMRI